MEAALRSAGVGPRSTFSLSARQTGVMHHQATVRSNEATVARVTQRSNAERRIASTGPCCPVVPGIAQLLLSSSSEYKMRSLSTVGAGGKQTRDSFFPSHLSWPTSSLCSMADRIPSKPRRHHVAMVPMGLPVVSAISAKLHFAKYLSSMTSR